MGKAELLVSFLLCISAVHAADHVVGDKNGWLDILVDYTEWAAGKKFVVGDKLIFNYDTTHDVAVVDKDGYDACIASTPPYTGGKTTITLTSPGLKYFICTISDHCSAGGMQFTYSSVGGPGGSPHHTVQVPRHQTSHRLPVPRALHQQIVSHHLQFHHQTSQVLAPQAFHHLIPHQVPALPASLHLVSRQVLAHRSSHYWISFHLRHLFNHHQLM
ncbi:hypothetical protein Leryth_025885 [Lithospermum erythrorhizon]|nr:hypothetical protein Leryth_025885 [Lithospermum erythrorhizon]